MSFINNAYAATGTAPAQGASSMAPMLIILIVIVLFYFWLWRQQSRKTKSQQQFLESLNKGDEVVTTGGITGKVTRVDGDYIGLSIAKGVEITVQKLAIASLLPKGTIKNLD